MIVKRNVTLLLFFAVMLSVELSAEDSPAASPGKVQICATCHGQNGIATISAYPKLAGQDRDYLIAALHAYKKRERNGGLAPEYSGLEAGYMPVVSYEDQLTDSQIAGLVTLVRRHFGGQAEAVTGQDVQAIRLALAKGGFTPQFHKTAEPPEAM